MSTNLDDYEDVNVDDIENSDDDYEFNQTDELEIEEFTNEVRNKLDILCEEYVNTNNKLSELKKIVKKTKDSAKQSLDNIQYIFEKHGQNTFTHNGTTFVFDYTQRRKQPKKEDLKKIIEEIVDDRAKIEQIYNEFESLTQVVDVNKIKIKKSR